MMLYMKDASKCVFMCMSCLSSLAIDASVLGQLSAASLLMSWVRAPGQ